MDRQDLEELVGITDRLHQLKVSGMSRRRKAQIKYYMTNHGIIFHVSFRKLILWGLK